MLENDTTGVDFVPALFGMLVPLVVELQRNFGVQPDAEVVIHHTLLCALTRETCRFLVNSVRPILSPSNANICLF